MAKTKAKEPEPIIENILAKHVFTNEETVELARELGRTRSQITALESEKSAISKDYASRIETREILSSSLADKVTSGYEMRPTDCLVIMDPLNRAKDYFLIGTGGAKGEFVERREMRPADFQMSLPKPADEGEVVP